MKRRSSAVRHARRKRWCRAGVVAVPGPSLRLHGYRLKCIRSVFDRTDPIIHDHGRKLRKGPRASCGRRYQGERSAAGTAAEIKPFPKRRGRCRNHQLPVVKQTGNANGR